MKTLEQILKNEPIFLHNWKSKIDMIGDFDDIYMTEEDYKAEKAPYANVELWEEKKVSMGKAIKRYENKNILFASYGQDNYQGDAWVLFEENGKLFEVNGSHCSCFGLEGQWEEEEVVLAELENRLTKGTFGQDNYSDNEFANELKTFLGIES
jgi:hypothetical protein